MRSLTPGEKWPSGRKRQAARTVRAGQSQFDALAGCAFLRGRGKADGRLPLLAGHTGLTVVGLSPDIAPLEGTKPPTPALPARGRALGHWMLGARGLSGELMESRRPGCDHPHPALLRPFGPSNATSPLRRGRWAGAEGTGLVGRGVSSGRLPAGPSCRQERLQRTAEVEIATKTQ